MASGVTIPRLNPDRRSSEVSDPTSFGSKSLKCSDQHRVSVAVPSIMTQSLQWCSQIAIKKVKKPRRLPGTKIYEGYLGLNKVTHM